MIIASDAFGGATGGGSEKFGHPDVGQDHHAIGSEEDASLVGDGECFVAFCGVGGSGERLDIGRRTLVAIIPSDLDGFAFGESGAWEKIMNHRVGRPRVGVGGGAFTSDAEGGGQGESGEHWVVDVATHIAESSRAEVEALAPV